MMRRPDWVRLGLVLALGCIVPHGSSRPSSNGWSSSGPSYRNNPAPYGYDPATARPPPYAPQPGGYAPPEDYEQAGGYDARGVTRGPGRPRPPGAKRRTGRAAARAGPRAGRRAGRAAAYGEYEEGAGLEDEEDDYALEEEEEMEVDAVDLYCSRSLGRLAVTLASGVVGTLIGSAISASVFHRPASFAVGGLVLGLVLSIFRNDFGALLRALGLMLILMLQRYKEAAGRYSALRQVGPAIGLAARRPFPPSENPWAYVRSAETDVEFSMTKSLLAVGFVGCFYGWLVGKIINIFILPPWLLALALGGICSYVATLRDGKGDLVRVLGMKIVALLALMRALDEELMVLSKLGKVCHISYSTAARVDAQYKIRERVWALAGWVMSLLNREADRVKHDMEGNAAPPSSSGYYGGPPPPGYGQGPPPRSSRQQEEDPWARPPPYNPEAQEDRRYGAGGGYPRR